MTKSGKHCGKRRNCSFWAISSFVTMFSKSRLLQRRQKASIWGKGLKTHLVENTELIMVFSLFFRKHKKRHKKDSNRHHHHHGSHHNLHLPTIASSPTKKSGKKDGSVAFYIDEEESDKDDHSDKELISAPEIVVDPPSDSSRA